MAARQHKRSIIRGKVALQPADPAARSDCRTDPWLFITAPMNMSCVPGESGEPNTHTICPMLKSSSKFQPCVRNGDACQLCVAGGGVRWLLRTVRSDTKDVRR